MRGALLAAAAMLVTAGAAPAQVWRSDQGDGTFRNPVLFADYPDPDVIRVGEVYYFVSTTFANVPGVTILESRDLVNWISARLAGPCPFCVSVFRADQKRSATLGRSRSQPGRSVSDQRAGSGLFSANLTATRGADGRAALEMEVTEDTVEGPRTQTRATATLPRARALWLRTDLDFTSDLGRLAYSLDGRRWTDLGGDFPLAFAWRTGTFQGPQFAIFCYAAGTSNGWVDVDRFTLSPLPPARPQAIR